MLESRDLYLNARYYKGTGQVWFNEVGLFLSPVSSTSGKSLKDLLQPPNMNTDVVS